MVQRFCLVSLTISNRKTSYRSLKQTAGSTSCPWTTILVSVGGGCSSSIHVYDHFDLYLTPVTLTFNLPKNVSNGTSPPQGQQLCQIVLKSMHYCTSYVPDKSGRLNKLSVDNHYSYFKCDLKIKFKKIW